jgi:tetratricopeptide (TPR) repeat protein
MRIDRKIASSLALCLALAAPAFASEYVKLKNGKVLKGRATAYDSQAKTLSWRGEDGKAATYKLDELDQRSVYMVNASLIAKDNGKGQIQLANYARDIGLYQQAARRYEYAEKADSSLKSEVEKERAVLRRVAAEACMKNAKDAIARNDIKEAEEWLSKLIEKLPNEPQAEEAAALLEKHYANERHARDDELEAKHAELLQKDLKKGKEHYDRMIERTKDGLTAKNSRKSVDLWESAIKDGEVVLDEIDKIEKKYGDDPKVQDGAARYRQLTIDQMIDAHLHLASHYTIKSSYKDAVKETNAALALDPRNQEALSQRARIEAASAEGLDIF